MLPQTTSEPSAQSSSTLSKHLSQTLTGQAMYT